MEKLCRHAIKARLLMLQKANYSGKLLCMGVNTKGSKRLFTPLVRHISSTSCCAKKVTPESFRSGEEELNENSDLSEEIQFARRFKDKRRRPEKYIETDEEWVQYTKFGRIRVDEKNKRKFYGSTKNVPEENPEKDSSEEKAPFMWMGNFGPAAKISQPEYMQYMFDHVENEDITSSEIDEDATGQQSHSPSNEEKTDSEDAKEKKPELWDRTIEREAHVRTTARFRHEPLILTNEEMMKLRIPQVTKRTHGNAWQTAQPLGLQDLVQRQSEDLERRRNRDFQRQYFDRSEPRDRSEPDDFEPGLDAVRNEPPNFWSYHRESRDFESRRKQDFVDLESRGFDRNDRNAPRDFGPHSTGDLDHYVPRRFERYNRNDSRDFDPRIGQDYDRNESRDYDRRGPRGFDQRRDNVPADRYNSNESPDYDTRGHQGFYAREPRDRYNRNESLDFETRGSQGFYPRESRPRGFEQHRDNVDRYKRESRDFETRGPQGFYPREYRDRYNRNDARSFEPSESRNFGNRESRNFNLRESQEFKPRREREYSHFESREFDRSRNREYKGHTARGFGKPTNQTRRDYSTGDSFMSRYSDINRDGNFHNNQNEQNVTPNSRNSFIDESVFEEQYFSEVHDRGRQASEKNSPNFRGQNIFEEQYFGAIELNNSIEGTTRKGSYNVDESVAPAWSYSSEPFHQSYPKNDQVPKSSVTENQGRNSEVNVNDNLIEQQYFQNRDEELQLPWETVEDTAPELVGDPRFKSKVVNTAERNDLLLKRGLKSMKSQAGFYKERDQVNIRGPNTNTGRTMWGRGENTGSDFYGIENADNTQDMHQYRRHSPAQFVRERYEQGDQSHLKSDFDMESDFYGIGDQRTASTLLEEENDHRQMSDKDMAQLGQRPNAQNRSQHRQRPVLKSQFGQHPRAQRMQYVSADPVMDEIKEKGPMTVAEVRQKIIDEKKVGGATDRGGPIVKQKQTMQDWQITHRWSGKVDSKGFRILKDQVLTIDHQTADDMVTILKRAILYEDDDLLAISKPYGLPSHGGPGVRHSVASLIPQLASELMGCENLFVIHRLDKETTGVMLLAKNKATCEIVSGMFRRREVVKQYLCVTKGCPKPLQGIIDIPMVESAIKTTGEQRMILAPQNQEYHEMVKDAGKKVKDNRSEAKPAVTNYRVLDAASEAALVLCQPETGLKHQIRCHLGFGMNTPILGDHKYSHFDKLAPQRLHPETLQRLGIRQTKVRHVPMHLHAKQLILPEYRNGRNFFVSASLPRFFNQNMNWLKLKLKT